MVKFEELESKIRQSRGSYSFTNDGQGKKTYTIFSDELKQSLRDTIHSTARAGEWQINHAMGTDSIKYRQEQNGKFGLYQKSLATNSPDKFVLLSENQSSTERKDFEADRKQFSESNQIMEEHRRQMEEHRRQVAESEQIIADSRRQVEDSRQQIINQGQNFPRSGEGAYISVSGDERTMREAFEILAREQREGASANQPTPSRDNQNQHQAQIRQNDNSNFFLTF
jgi:hypothetical protein